MLSLEGRQLGNYEVIRRIRAGGMGAVYEGKQRTAFDRRVAIKVILGNYAADKDMRRRFAREARTVARLHHPHILPLIEYGDEQGILYLVMPFIEGGTLTSYLRRGLPDLNELAAIYQQLLDAVEYAHDEGLIHRDIKSSNVLLEQRRSGVPHVYLADFGLVRTSRQAELEQAGKQGKPLPLDQVPGTPHYMAPEQTRGIVTTSSDIYALGVLLYQMLTGELPYDDPDEEKVIQMHLTAPVPFPSDHDATIPYELSEVVRTAMAKRIEDRYDSVAELRQAFLAAIQAQAVIIENNLEDDEVIPPSLASLAPLDADHPVVMPLASYEPPAPMLLAEQRRNKQVAHEAFARGTQRITDDVRPNRLRTTEPVRGARVKRRRLALSVMAVIFVPVLLLSLLIAPRIMGISLFPVGVPLLGADPTATVSVTPQLKNLNDAYILTASSQVSNANVTTREIPDRTVPGAATDSRTVQTTDTASVAGAQASGYLLFDNSGDAPVTVFEGTTFDTTSGVSVQTTGSVEVPAQQNGQDGTVTTAAVAVNAGTAGNIPANALARKCCHGLFVSNPAHFSGGVDAHQVRAVSQADIDGVSNSLSSSLQQQVLKLLLQKMAPGEVMTQLPVYDTTVAPAYPVGAHVSQVNVRVTVSTSVIVYNRTVAGKIATQLLEEQAAQTLGSGYAQQGAPTVGVPHVFQQGKNGVIYLSVPVRAVWVYTFSTQQLNQWKQSIRGATRDAALAYLNVQGGVQAVQIHLPFGTDHFPTTVDQIKILVV
jgi:serine/threonine protein kinase